MKQKKIGKKLNLNKNTIAALDNRQIKAARGGGPTCASCAQTCTCYGCTYISGALTSCPPQPSLCGQVC
jgi:natural product precursor